jgi:cyanate lyase
MVGSQDRAADRGRDVLLRRAADRVVVTLDGKFLPYQW